MTSRNAPLITVIAALLAAVTALVWAGRGFADTTTAPGGDGCPAVAGIFVPGTWETTAAADTSDPKGMLAPIATELTESFGARFQAVTVAYPAKAMDGMLYGDSEAQGVTAVKSSISDISNRCSATKFVLAGYSQGADAAGDVASAIGCHQDPVPASRVIAVGLLADPKQGTQGGKLVGTPLSGTGIRGTRADGFCQLSAVTAQICQPGDRYCNTTDSSNPVLSSLAKLITDPTTGTGTLTTTPTPTHTATTTPTAKTPATATATPRPTPTPTKLTTTTQATTPASPAVPGAKTPDRTQALDAGFSIKDLASVPAAIARIIDAARNGTTDASTLAADAGTVATVLTKLTDLNTWVGANPAAQQQLSTASPNSGQGDAATVLSAVKNLDLTSVVTALSTIAQKATATSGGDNALAAAATVLSNATSTLTSVQSGLGNAAGVLSLLKPATVINQVANVATNTVSFAANLPKILTTLGQIGAVVGDASKDLAAKVRGVHDTFRTLNSLCQPLVTMAASVDLKTVGSLIALIPDTTGVAPIAGVIVSILGNLDVVGLARQIGQLQEDLWKIVETITGGGDLIAIGASFANLVPTLLGFASLALTTLTGTGTKTDASQLNVPLTTSGGGADLSSLASTLTNAASSQGATDLSTLVNDGLTAVDFVKSGAHQSYDTYVVDSAGHTALQWLALWFANRIRQVGIGV
ncbi:cutinase family protein [Nocardia tengchongensis]|uniref:cutinase family protein n=1 Tax=Nocardia tengchongensis TaxID=2055889 RepID=UPI00369BD6F6